MNGSIYFFHRIAGAISGLHPRLTEKQSLFVLSILIGMISGLAAVIVKLAVHFLRSIPALIPGDISWLWVIGPLAGTALRTQNCFLRLADVHHANLSLYPNPWF